MYPLLDYLKDKADNIHLIRQPHPYCKDLRVEGLWWPLLTIRKRVNKTSLWLKLRDFYSVIRLGRRVGKIDLFIGVEVVNALAGWFLRAG